MEIIVPWDPAANNLPLSPFHGSFPFRVNCTDTLSIITWLMLSSCRRRVIQKRISCAVMQSFEAKIMAIMNDFKGTRTVKLLTLFWDACDADQLQLLISFCQLKSHLWLLKFERKGFSTKDLKTNEFHSDTFYHPSCNYAKYLKLWKKLYKTPPQEILGSWTCQLLTTIFKTSLGFELKQTQIPFFNTCGVIPTNFLRK